MNGNADVSDSLKWRRLPSHLAWARTISLFLFVGCLLSHGGDEWSPHRIWDGGKVGLIDTTGKIIAPLDYEWLDETAAGGFLRCKKPEGLGFLDSTGSERIPCRFQDARRSLNDWQL